MKKHASRAAALIASAVIGAALALGAFIVTEGTSGSSTPATSTIVEGTASPAAVTTSPKSVADIYAGAVSGVVEIKVRENATGQSITPFGPTQQTQLAQGTGFEIDRNGDIATNAHVVSGASSITVQTHDGKTYKATLVEATRPPMWPSSTSTRRPPVCTRSRSVTRPASASATP